MNWNLYWTLLLQILIVILVFTLPVSLLVQSLFAAARPRPYKTRQERVL